MSILTIAQDAEMHREAYSALIRGCLRRPGAKQRFAHDAQITPQYLRYILVTQAEIDAHDLVTRREVAPRTAERIASRLPLPEELRHVALAHMLAAREAEVTVKREIKSVRDDFDQTLWSVRHTQHRATHGQDAAVVHFSYLGVIRVGQELIRQINGQRHPLDFAELCMCLHGALCVLDDNASALYYTRLAEFHVTQVPSGLIHAQGDWYNALSVNAVRGAAIAYNNLGLPREALGELERAEELQQVKDNRMWWGQHLASDRFSATSKLTRFPVSRLRTLYNEVMDRSGASMSESVKVMLDTRLANSYTIAGNLKKAGALLDPHIDTVDESAALGSLHQVIFMNACARLALARGDTAGVTYWHNRSKTQARSAGLLHQERSLALALGQTTD